MPGPTLDVLLFGDSHTAALRRGQKSLEADGRWPEEIRLAIRPLGGGHLATVPFFADRGDHAEVTLPEYRRQFDRLPPADDPPGTVYGVSALLHPVRLWRHPAWAEAAPADMAEAGSMPADRPPSVPVPVSSGTVRRLALDDQRPMLELVALLRRIGRRVFAVEAPRPFRHHPALRRTPAAVVMRVDALYRETIRAELDRLGVPVVAVPARCRDAEGFTRPEFGQAGDPHHGNADYGAAMMGEVLGHLTGAGPAGPTSPPAAPHEGRALT